MPIFMLRITQHFAPVTREITVRVEADDLESAIEQQQSDCAPDFDDPDWQTGWGELVSEEVTAA